MLALKFLILLGFLFISYSQAKKIRTEEPTVVSGDIYVAPKAVKDITDEKIKLSNYSTKTKQDIKRTSRRLKRSHNNRSEQRKRTLAIGDETYLWEGGVIPYEISPNISERLERTINTAIRKWESVTCLKFVPADENEHEYSIFFENEGECGCCSYIGKNYWMQEITLMEYDCNMVNIVLHEIGHAIGFHHEQNRPDRDKYIKVLYEHIEEEQAEQYGKLPQEEINTLGFAYDFDSIMHYASNFFSTGGETMAVIKNNSDISLKGRRYFLSQTDIEITNKLYKCPACLFNIKNKRGTVYFNTSMTDETYCEWYIKRDHGEYIEFIVDYVNVPDNENCTEDYVDFIDGYSFSGSIIDSICGNKTFKDFYLSSSNYLLVTFERSSRSSFAEFSFRYKVACGEEIYGDEGTVRSPRNFPEDHPYSNDCIWIITVPQDYRVALHFESFNLGDKETDCNSTYVEIWDNIENGSNLLHTFCGSEVPPDVLSFENNLEIKFVSDVWNKEIGFTASFVKEINECESEDNAGCSDSCVNTIGSYHCECGKGRHLFPDFQQCEEYSNKCGGILNLTKPTIITSPTFPDLYPRNTKCTWKVVNKNLAVSFLHMDIQGSEGECVDKVEIIGFQEKKSSIDIFMYCSDTIPKPFNLTDTSNLRIEFQSDLLVQNTGFAILLEPFDV